MANRLWIIPGYMGSELYRVQRDGSGRITGRRKLWLNIGNIGTGIDAEALTLPAAPGVEIVAGDALFAGYGDMLLYLTQDNRQPPGWTVQAWGYDWRKGALALGQQLAEAILAAPEGAGSHAIVAHSYGAMVAQAAWVALKAQGKQSYVRRIITLGAILYGCYSPTRTWALYEDSINLFATAPRFVNDLTTPGLRWSPDPTNFALLLLRAFNSWPSTYDMLPDVSKRDDPADSERGMCYQAWPWQYTLAQPDVAAVTAQIASPLSSLFDPANWPPPEVITHYVGHGYMTPSRIHAAQYTPDQLRRLRYGSSLPTAQHVHFLSPSYDMDSSGDGRATQAQQQFAGREVILVNGAHAEMQSHPGILANLWGQVVRQAKVDPPADMPFPAWPQLSGQGPRGGHSLRTLPAVYRPVRA